MGATASVIAMAGTTVISIHAPAMGATYGWTMQEVDAHISIHAPAMGATQYHLV